MANLRDNGTTCPHTTRQASAPPWSAVTAAVQLQACGKQPATRLQPRAAPACPPTFLGAGCEVPGRRAMREGRSTAEQASNRTRMLGAAAQGRRARQWPAKAT